MDHESILPQVIIISCLCRYDIPPILSSCVNHIYLAIEFGVVLAISGTALFANYVTSHLCSSNDTAAGHKQDVPC